MTSFEISKNNKIQPFLSLKKDENIKKNTRISFDPDSKHVGLPPYTNHSNRKLQAIGEFELKIEHKLTKIKDHSNRCYGAKN